MNKTVILSCTSLKDYVELTQKKLNTDYPVIYLSKVYHRDPEEMREHVIGALEGLDPEVETVLVSMGFCGGSWDKVKVPCRVVIPRVDDCISLLLQTTDEPVSNLKKPDHLYVKDKDPDKENFKSIFDHLTKDIDEETKKRYHEDWMRYYREIDIIETEINDSRRSEYAEKVKADADWLQAEMAYVPGGTHLLEKLISGNWDEQFMVFEPGEITGNILI